MRARRLRTRLTWAWWLIMPPFAVLVARLDIERACAEPYELLPGAATVPWLAWSIAALYLAAHALLTAACLVTVLHAGTLAPSPRVIRTLWGRQLWMLIVTVLIFVLEYWPVPMWQALGRHVLGCAP
jgi:hypothetical protein